MNTCKKCGAPAPEGKEVCWCCGHEGKLHKTDLNTVCSGDSCKVGEHKNA